MNVTSEPTVSVPPRWAMSTPSIVRGIDSRLEHLLQARSGPFAGLT